MDDVVREIGRLAAAVTVDIVGFPPDEHLVRPPAATLPPGLPESLHDLYTACDGLGLPDVHVGYFIDRAARVVDVSGRPDTPRRIDGSSELLTVFGSDGGGGRFAVAHVTHEILYLPSGGGVHDQVFTSTSPLDAPQRVAESVAGFLARLRDDLQAFLRQDRGWTYMAR